MEEQKKHFVEWVKAHKKQVFIGGVCAVGGIGIILFLLKKDDSIKLWTFLKKSKSKTLAKPPKAGNQMPKVQEVCSAMTEFVNEAPEAPRSYTFSTGQFKVSKHIRNLSEGQHASPEKIAEAEELGIKLLSNQTLVNSYVKRGVAA